MRFFRQDARSTPSSSGGESKRLSFCMTADILEFVTVSEAARRIGAVSNTLRRKLERNEARPDAELIEGAKQLRSPLFLAARLPELQKLIKKDTR